MNNERLNFFGKEINIDEIAEIGAFIEEAKLLWLIPMTRISPEIKTKDGSTLRGSGMSPQQVAEWVAVTNMEMKLNGKNGQETVSEDGAPKYIYN